MAAPGPSSSSSSDAPFVVRSGTRMAGRHAHSRSSSKPFVVQVANARSPLLAGNSFASAHKRIVDVGPAGFAQVGKKAALLVLKWGSLVAMVTFMIGKINERGVPRPSLSGLTTVHHEGCADPLLEPGYLAFDEHDAVLTRWVPFNKTCPPPANYLALLRSYLSTTPASGPMAIPSKRSVRRTADGTVVVDGGGDEEDEPDGEGSGRLLKRRKPSHPAAPLPADPALTASSSVPPELEFLRGKTFVVLGDSVDRNAITHLCHAIGRPLRVTSWADPSRLAPEPPADSPREDFALTQLEPLRAVVHGPDFEGYDQRGLPHVCEVAELDFVAMNGFHYGMDSADRFNVPAHPDWRAPGRFEDRLASLFAPYLEARGRTPDVVTFSSGLWDEALFGREDDAVDERIVERPLDWGRMWWWGDRARLSVEAIQRTWPKAQVAVRKMHRPAKDGDRQRWMSNVRIHQLRNAQEQLARSHDLPVIDFGALLEGFQVHQEKIHPLFNPGVVLPHAFLHQLKRLDDRRQAGLAGWRRKLHL